MSALIAITAGPYSATWDSTAIGQTENGFELSLGFSKEDVLGDLYGDSVIDSVYRGGNCTLRCTGLVWASIIAVRNPYGGDIGATGLIGRMDVGSGIAVSLVLTAVAGTTAAASPASLTAVHAIIDKESNDPIGMNNRARKVPVQFRLYPSTVTATDRWFSVT